MVIYDTLAKLFALVGESANLLVDLEDHIDECISPTTIAAIQSAIQQLSHAEDQIASAAETVADIRFNLNALIANQEVTHPTEPGHNDDGHTH